MSTIVDQNRDKALAGGPATQEYIFNQTMLRVKNPEHSVKFYRDVLGMNSSAPF